MAEGMKSEDLALVGFYEAMERSNAAKIDDEILGELSDDSEGNEDFDFDIGVDDAKDRPWRPNHVNFGKSIVKKGILRP
jgi:hypothetical protein